MVIASHAKEIRATRSAAPSLESRARSEPPARLAAPREEPSFRGAMGRSFVAPRVLHRSREERGLPKGKGPGQNVAASEAEAVVTVGRLELSKTFISPTIPPFLPPLLRFIRFSRSQCPRGEACPGRYLGTGFDDMTTCVEKGAEDDHYCRSL